MNKDKKESLINIYYCFRYRCKRCPKQRECEEEAKKEEQWKKKVKT
jgi:hypothetical protein